MARRDSRAVVPLPSPLAFIELASADPETTGRFLSKVFGWKVRALPMGKQTYLGFDTPGGGRGGVRPARPDESPSTTSYVRVEDLEVARRQVEAAGGRIVLPTVELPGMGSFFWFQVPSGPVMACWKDAAPSEPRG